MRKIHRLLPLFLLVLVLCFRLSSAQTTTLEIVRNVNLRPEPTVSSDEIDLLQPGQTLILLNPVKRNGYYSVRAEGVGEGWVWARNVRLTVPATEDDNDEIISDSSATLAPAAATAVLSTWNKPPMQSTVFNGSEGSCPPTGNGFDPVQYSMKNRADTPTSLHDVTWSAIDNLPFPGKTDGAWAPKHRKDWNQGFLSVVAPFEGIPVRVVGYLVAIKPQNGGSGEGTNCKFTRAGNVDAHLALVKEVGDAEKESIVIEWTPRFTQKHPKWTKTRLLPWLDSDKAVRISGFLMVDPDHVNHLGRYRRTLWEVHPITKIEVFQNGNFIDIDLLP